MNRILPAGWALILISLFGCASDKTLHQPTAEPSPSRDQSNGPTIYGKVYAGVTLYRGPGREH